MLHCINKTIWLTLSQLAVPLGIVLGYVTTAVFVSNFTNRFSDSKYENIKAVTSILDSQSWRLSFYLQCVLLIPISLLFLCYRSKYFQSKRRKRSEIIEGRISIGRSVEDDGGF